MSIDIAVMSICFVIANHRYDQTKTPDSVWPYGTIAALIALIGYVVTDDMAKGMIMVPAVFLMTCGGVWMVYYLRRRLGR